MQTENNRKMCKHIKDKEKLPFSDQLPFVLYRGKNSARNEEECKMQNSKGR